MYRFASLIVFAALAISQATAREVPNSRRGLLWVLTREGCQPGWLAATMKMNGILEFELTELPDGPVQIPDNCSEAPSRSEQRASLRVLRGAAAALPPAPAGGSEFDVLKAEHAKVTAEASVLQETINKLQQQLGAAEEGEKKAVASLRREEQNAATALAKQWEAEAALRKVLTERRKETSNGLPWAFGFFGAAVGFLLAVIIGVARDRWVRKNHLVIPKVRRVRYKDGKTYTFPLVTPEVNYSFTENGCRTYNLKPTSDLGKFLDRRGYSVIRVNHTVPIPSEPETVTTRIH